MSYRTILKTILAFITLTAASVPAMAQRLQDHNTIFWGCSFNTIRMSKYTSLWLEYQWRREGGFTNWQQSLARGGIQVHLNKDVSVLAGYGYIITYPYGEYPAGPYTIPEQRIFEQLSWNDNRGRIMLNHRFRLEQRFLGKINQAAPEYEVTDWTYVNRIRYQLRLQVPLNRPKMEDKTWYLASFDELFIGFGPNVNQNVFDQNRIALLAGYQINKMFRIEGGVLNQTVQQGGLVGGKQVYQYNTGGILSLYFTRM
ncbi:MAG: DUF2490 domain-containing protein [Bacteroidota bacterium]